MNRLISFSLYGDAFIYQSGAIQNAILAKKIYPDWTCRFYVSQEVPMAVVRKIEKENAEVVPMVRKLFADGMFWRFLPASEENLEALIVRDADSRLNVREAAAVSDWLKSDKAFHIMRDHPYHVNPILGGLWGVKGGVLSNIDQEIRKWRLKRYLTGRKVFHSKYQDQKFLREVIYPIVKDSALIHSNSVRYDDEELTPFPTRRKSGEFVGQIVTENEEVVDGNWEKLNKKELVNLKTEHYSLLYQLKNKTVNLLLKKYF